MSKLDLNLAKGSKELKIAQQNLEIKASNDMYNDPKLISKYHFVPRANEVHCTLLREPMATIIGTVKEANSGAFSLHQKVIAVGPDCRELKPGDIINIKIENFKKPARKEVRQGQDTHVSDYMEIEPPVYVVGDNPDTQMDVLIITERDYLYKVK